MTTIPQDEFGYLTIVVERDQADILKERLGDLAEHMTESRPLNNQDKSRPFHETHFAFQLNLNADTPHGWVSRLCSVAVDFRTNVFYIGKGGTNVGIITDPGIWIDFKMPNGEMFLMAKPIKHS